MRTVDREEEAVHAIIKLTGGAPAVTVDAAKRGSWSRPIGPRLEPRSDDGSGGGGCTGGGGTRADDVVRSSNSTKSRSGPKSRSRRQVTLHTEGAVDSEAQQARENGGEACVFAKKRGQAEDREGMSGERTGEAQQ